MEIGSSDEHVGSEEMEIEEEGEDEENDEEVIDGWVKAIDAGGVDDSEDDDDDSDSGNDKVREDEDDEEYEKFDFMCFETKAEIMDEWPIMNENDERKFKDWPQEDPDYFKLKKKEIGHMSEPINFPYLHYVRCFLRK